MLRDLPQSKWGAGTGDQKILKTDFGNLERAVLEAFELASKPGLVWVDNATCRVEAAADSPARALLCGFANILQPGTYLTAGLTDGRYRENLANVSCNFGLGGALWGSEKASQWYAILATAGNADTTFALTAMPYMRVKSQAGQVISLGANVTPATGIGYGFAADQFVDGSKLYVLSGVSKGLLRTILHNNNDNGNGGTIEYTGAALALAPGDWFIVLPATNFRRLADVYNDAVSNFTEIKDLIYGKDIYSFHTPGTFPFFCPLTWNKAIRVDGSAGGAGGVPPYGGGGGGGGAVKDESLTMVPGTYYLITIAATAAANTNGGDSSIGALLTLLGGAKPASGTDGGAAGGPGGQAGENGDGSSYGGNGGSGLWGVGGVKISSNGVGFGSGGGGAASVGNIGSQGFFDLKRGNN